MPASGQESASPSSLSVVVPFHRGLNQLSRCLEAVRRATSELPSGGVQAELIVAADSAVDDPAAVARDAEARLLALSGGPRGPAFARNRAAASATGDLLVFVDADVLVSGDALGRLADLFVSDPELGAAFGAYDEEPADPGFFSQARNLAHSFIHQRSNRDAQTFWAGLGAVRADVFAKVGGFDERFSRPSVEDIDLGYRIREAGHRIVLDPTIQGKHLKRWSLRSGLVTDIRDRGIPWTQLLSRYRSMRNDLNLTFKYRACVVLAYVLVACLIGTFWLPILLLPAAICLAALWLLDKPYYQFFIERRGLLFSLAWFPFHILHHLGNGVSFAVGTALVWVQRWTGLMLPATLPSTPWAKSDVREAAPDSPEPA